MPSTLLTVLSVRIVLTSSSNIYPSSTAGPLVRGVITTSGEKAFERINYNLSLIISLAFPFSWWGTLSSMSGTIRVAWVVTHLLSILSWFPGT